MKKIFIFLLIIFLYSCTGHDKTHDLKSERIDIDQEPIEYKYGNLTKYIKSNITDNESRKLEDILKTREEFLLETKSMIESATKENKNQVYKQIVYNRKLIFDKISVYVPEEKMQSFISYNKKINLMIKNKLYNK